MKKEREPNFVAIFNSKKNFCFLFLKNPFLQ